MNSLKNYLHLANESYSYTKNLFLSIKILYLWLIWLLKRILPLNNYYKKITSSYKDYIFTTPFWKYLCTTTNEYFMMDKDYEPEIKKIINQGKWKYFINIGCNIWRWAIDIAKNYWYNVLAFEPVPYTYNELRINVILSNLEDKIKMYNIWLWSKNGKMHMEYKPRWCGASHVVEDNYTKTENGDIIEVNIKRFDDLKIDNEIITNTKLIIMDVEWFEYEVIKWMKNTLCNLHNVKIIVEIRDNPNKEGTIKFMKDLWYNVKKIDEADYLFYK